jgi:hypothetical protein
MRSLVGVVAFLGGIGTADASPCSVNIARAPDDVREVVTSWVLAERDCGPPLEVRIVETSGGLYVLARDEAGRVRERVVPDAQSAGVLIASWAASGGDDPTPSAVAGELTVDMTWTPPSPSAAIAPSSPKASLSVAPGMSPTTPGLADRGVAGSASRKGPTKWLALGAMIGVGGAGAQGVRGEVDVVAHGRWRFGVAGSIEHVDMNPDLGRYSGYLDLIDMQAAAFAAHTVDVGNWQLRAAAGVGFVVTKGNGTLFDRADINEKAALWPQISDVSPIGEASLSISHGLGWNWPGWGLQLGPVVTVHDQSFELRMGESLLPYESELARTSLELMFLGAIRHEL